MRSRTLIKISKGFLVAGSVATPQRKWHCQRQRKPWKRGDLPLAKSIEYVSDDEVFELARRLMDLLESELASRPGDTYNVYARNFQGTVTGPNAEVTQHFNSPPDKNPDE